MGYSQIYLIAATAKLQDLICFYEFCTMEIIPYTAFTVQQLLSETILIENTFGLISRVSHNIYHELQLVSL